MSLHIFLNEEAYNQLAKREGDQLILHARGVGKLAGIQVRIDGDCRPYYEVRDETGPLVCLVPFALRPYAEAYSWHTQLPPDSPTRILGRYAFQTAEAIVDHKRDKQGWRTVRIHGPKIEDVHQLYYKLRAGTAELVEGWQTSQAALENAIDRALALPDEPETQSQKVHFQCASCGAKYAIARGKVAGRKTKIRCRSCGDVTRLNDGRAENPEKSVGHLRLVKPGPRLHDNSRPGRS